jgi:exonuclease III
VLSWNVRGLNSEPRQRAVREKINSSQYAVVCLQETKCTECDRRLIRNICPRRFDEFIESPSRGASGGLLVVWRSDIFTNTLVEVKPFGIIINFTSVHNNDNWTLVNVYGPSQGQMRDEFFQWLYNLNIEPRSNWMLMGDFNFIKSLENRNLPSGDVNDIFIFNEIIGQLGFLELPLKGRRFTWSNMQDSPLLEQLDWIFTSANWIDSYPMSQVIPLARTTSDHVPCLVSICTSIPKANIFRFENYWVEHPGFMECVQQAWANPSSKQHITAVIVDKLKALRMALKKWQKGISHIKILIDKCNMVIWWLDNLKEFRPLYRQEFNFRKMVKLHHAHLVHLQCVYWKKRCTIRYIKVGEENSKNSRPWPRSGTGGTLLPH